MKEMHFETKEWFSMNFELAYGKRTQQVEIDERNLAAVLTPNAVDISLTNGEEVARAMQNPIGTPRLFELVKPGEKVAIITSDITRPLPTRLILPYVLDELKTAGCKFSDVSVIFALGAHRNHTEQEMRYLVGDENYELVKCIDSNPEDCVHLGETEAGTPVDIFRVVAEADKRICLGNVEYHYFAGYSGGAKAIMPGVSTRAAIQANHSKMIQDTACAGRIEGNPVRKDIDDVAKILPIDFIVNVVLDEHKTIIKAAAGHYKEAHRSLCAFLDTLYKVEIDQRADIVIVSPGGFPKDINLYQAQKALDNAKHAVRNGGILILVASCKEGLGEHVFERWMTQSKSSQSMVRDIEQNFELGGHKAAAIAMVLQNAEIYLVSDFDPDFARKIFFTPFASLGEAYDAAKRKFGVDARVIVMPFGGSTLPAFKKR
jgi:nickel-dependent lactate racemase